MIRDIGLLKFRHLKSRSCKILTFEKKDIQFEARRRPLWFSNWACVVKNHSSFKQASERASSSSYYFLILARARVRLSALLFLLCAVLGHVRLVCFSGSQATFLLCAFFGHWRLVCFSGSKALLSCLLKST
jgi:hypothetical protein